MSLICLLYHDWEVREKNPHRDTDDGAARICKSCGKMEWDYRVPG